MFWKHCSRLKNPVLDSDPEQCSKKPMKHPENTNLTCFEAFQEFLEKLVLGSKIRFSDQMSNIAKNTLKHPENTNKTCFEAFWEILENPVLGSKMWFSAQISNYANLPWNTQKAPTKYCFETF